MTGLAEAYAEHLVTCATPQITDQLTINERDAVALMANGKSQAEIAHALKIGQAHVRALIVRARRKAGARTREHLAALWVAANFKAGRLS